MNRVSLGLLVTVVSLLSGCGTVTETTDHGSVFKNDWNAVLVFLGLAAALFGAGIYYLRGSVKKVRVKRKTASGVRKSNRTQISYRDLIAGILFMIAGLFALFVGVPATSLAYVRVEPDKLVLRNQILWFLDSPREVPFEDINGFSVTEEERRGRRGRRYTVHTLVLDKRGGREEINMQKIHFAALPALKESLENYWEEHSGPGRTLAQQGGLPDPLRGDPGLLGRAGNESRSRTRPSSPVNPGKASPSGSSANPAPTERPDQSPLTHVEKEPAPSDSSEPAETAARDQPPAADRPTRRPAPDRAIPDESKLVQIDRFGFFEKGLEVKVRQDDDWRPGVIMQVYHHYVKVRYHDADEEEDAEEIVTMGTVIPDRQRMPRSPSRLAGTKPPGFTTLETVGGSVSPQEELKPGTRLAAQFAGKWRLVEVLDVDEAGKVKIHWVGHTDNFDRWIEPAKLHYPPEED